MDKTPTSLLEALENTLNTNLYDAVIHGFALHWDLADLKKAMPDGLHGGGTKPTVTGIGLLSAMRQTGQDAAPRPVV